MSQTSISNAYRDPVTEVMFDLTWIYVNWHDKQPRDVQETLMDYFGGSRGLFERLYEEAEEFTQVHKDVEWGEDANSDYFVVVDRWGGTKINDLRALMAKARVAEGVLK